MFIRPDEMIPTEAVAGFAFVTRIQQRRFYDVRTEARSDNGVSRASQKGMNDEGMTSQKRP